MEDLDLEESALWVDFTQVWELIDLFWVWFKVCVGICGSGNYKYSDISSLLFQLWNIFTQKNKNKFNRILYYYRKPFPINN